MRRPSRAPDPRPGPDGRRAPPPRRSSTSGTTGSRSAIRRPSRRTRTAPGPRSWTSGSGGTRAHVLGRLGQPLARPEAPGLLVREALGKTRRPAHDRRLRAARQAPEAVGRTRPPAVDGRHGDHDLDPDAGGQRDRRRADVPRRRIQPRRIQGPGVRRRLASCARSSTATFATSTPGNPDGCVPPHPRDRRGIAMNLRNTRPALRDARRSCCSPRRSSAELPASNPFAAKSPLSFQAPPFDKIKDADYLPAFEEGMKQQLAEIEAIANEPGAADVREHHRSDGAVGRAADARREGVLQPRPVQHERRDPEDQGRGRAEARRAPATRST